MKIPKTVQVLNAKYKIKIVKGLAQTAGNWGHCDSAIKTISLDSGMVGAHLARVLMHELMHAVQFESGMVDFMGMQTCEMSAETLAGFLCAVFEFKFK